MVDLYLALTIGVPGAFILYYIINWIWGKLHKTPVFKHYGDERADRYKQRIEFWKKW